MMPAKDPFTREQNFKKVNIITAIVFLGFFISIFYHYYISRFLHLNYYPYNTFFYKPKARFNDFYVTYNSSGQLNPFAHETSNYFPFFYFVMYFFTFFSMKVSLFTFFGIFIAFLAVYLYRYMPVRNKLYNLITVAILTCLSYPVIFDLERGNVEPWVFMPMVMFMILYIKEKYIWSVIFLSAAVSFKLYPALFVMLFIIDRKYMLALYTGICSGIMTLVSLVLFKVPVIESIRDLKAIMTTHSWVLKGGTIALQHSVSLYVPVKLMFYNALAKLPVAPHHFAYEDAINKYYLMISAPIFVIVILFLLRYKLDLWKRVCIIIMLFTLLPQISFEYKLMHLFIPILLFIHSDSNSRMNLVYCVLFGLLLIPKDYMIIASDLSIAPVIDSLLMFLFIILIMIEAIRSGQTIKFSSYFERKRKLVK